MHTLHSRSTSNKVKSFLIFLGFPLVILGMVRLITYYTSPQDSLSISLIALIISVVYGIIMYYSGSSIALAMNGCIPITRESDKKIYRMVENLCLTMGQDVPAIYLIQDDSLNAFATGRSPKHASIALTQGIINKLEDEELEGVIAHELSHIKNYDTLVMIFTLIMINIIQILAEILLRASFSSDHEGKNPIFLIASLGIYFFGGIIGFIIQQAISRKREFLADSDGALLTRYPQGLANALRKISGDARIEEIDGKRAFASSYIANPLEPGFISKLFSSHPPIADRIRVLESMGMDS